MSNDAERRDIMRELNELLRQDAETAFDEPPRRVATKGPDGRIVWSANPAHQGMRATRRRIEVLRRTLYALDRS